jgi:hypothetical protein
MNLLAGVPAAAIAADACVLDGNYGIPRDLVGHRATHLVWLDFDRPIIMYRVIRRSLFRAVLRTEMCAGNRETAHTVDLRPFDPGRLPPVEPDNSGIGPPRSAEGRLGRRSSRQRRSLT